MKITPYLAATVAFLAAAAALVEGATWAGVLAAGAGILVVLGIVNERSE